MKLDLLENLNDDELLAVEARAAELRKAHDRQRKDKALADAGAILAAAGLSFKDVGRSKGKPKAKASSYHSGHRYQHPGNPVLTWNAKGKKPQWLTALEAEGKAPVELGVTKA